jgi:hypothetical protein
MAHVVTHISLPLYIMALLLAIFAGILHLPIRKPRRIQNCSTPRRVLAGAAVPFIVISVSLDITSALRKKGNVGLAGLVLHCLAVILLLVFINLDFFLDRWIVKWRQRRTDQIASEGGPVGQEQTNLGSSIVPPQLSSQPPGASTSLEKRDCNAPPKAPPKAVLFMSPVIWPSTGRVDPKALFAFYCTTMLPTYAPPPVDASFVYNEAEETVLKLEFPSEPFIDLFINFWNKSLSKHDRDSLRTIKLSKEYT